MYRAKLCFKDNYLLAKVVQTGEYSVKIMVMEYCLMYLFTMFNLTLS